MVLASGACSHPANRGAGARPRRDALDPAPDRIFYRRMRSHRVASLPGAFTPTSIASSPSSLLLRPTELPTTATPDFHPFARNWCCNVPVFPCSAQLLGELYPAPLLPGAKRQRAFGPLGRPHTTRGASF